MTFHKQLFNGQSLRVGWSMLWRTWLAAFALEVIFSLPVMLWYHHPPTSDPAALRAHLDKIRDISSLPALVALVPAFNWIGKSVLRKRNLPVPTRFIGWSLFWRAMAFSFTLGVAAAVMILMPVGFWFHSGWVNTVAPPFALAVMFTVIMCSYGWATLRVSRMATPD